MIKVNLLTHIAICTFSIALTQSVQASCLSLCCGCDDSVDEFGATEKQNLIQHEDRYQAPTQPLLKEVTTAEGRGSGPLHQPTSSATASRTTDAAALQGLKEVFVVKDTDNKSDKDDTAAEKSLRRTSTATTPKASPMKKTVSAKILIEADRTSASESQKKLLQKENTMQFSEKFWELLAMDDRAAEVLLDAIKDVNFNCIVHVVIATADTFRVEIYEDGKSRPQNKIVRVTK